MNIFKKKIKGMSIEFLKRLNLNKSLDEGYTKEIIGGKQIEFAEFYKKNPQELKYLVEVLFHEKIQEKDLSYNEQLHYKQGLSDLANFFWLCKEEIELELDNK